MLVLDGVRDRDGGREAWAEEERVGRREGEKGGMEGGLTTRRRNRTVEFQPDFQTIQVGSKIQKAFQ